MNSWEKQSFALTIQFGAAAIIISGIFDVRIAAGIFLGIVFGLVHHMLLRNYLNSIVETRNFSVLFFILYFLGNFGMFAIPFYIGSVYPEFVNVFGAAFGLTLHKIMIYVRQFIMDRKER